MAPMDRAWQLLKMPVYDTDAGVQFVTQGKGEPKWKDDPNVYGRPASEGPTEMWTPNDFLQWWDGGAIYGEKTPRQAGFAQEKPHGYKTRFDEAENNPNIKFGMPYLGFVGDDPKPLIHDGRHRMVELKERGHGDTPLPVRVIRE